MGSACSGNLPGFNAHVKEDVLSTLKRAIENFDADALKVMYYDISMMPTVDEILIRNEKDCCEECEEKEVCDSVAEPEVEPEDGV